MAEIWKTSPPGKEWPGKFGSACWMKRKTESTASSSRYKCAFLLPQEVPGVHRGVEAVKQGLLGVEEGKQRCSEEAQEAQVGVEHLLHGPRAAPEMVLWTACAGSAEDD